MDGVTKKRGLTVSGARVSAGEPQVAQLRTDGCVHLLCVVNCPGGERGVFRTEEPQRRSEPTLLSNDPQHSFPSALAFQQILHITEHVQTYTANITAIIKRKFWL